MEEKLLSRFKNKIGLRFLRRIFLGLFGVFFVAWMDFSLWSLAILVFLWIFLYFSGKSGNHKEFKASFWLLPVLFLSGSAMIGAERFFSSPLLIFVLGIMFGAVLFLVEGGANLFFSDKETVLGVANTVVIFSLFLVFGGLFKMSVLWAILLPAVFFFLMKEHFAFFRENVSPSPLFAFVLAFLCLELFFVVKMLPLGIINGSAFLTLSAVTLRDASLAHARKSLTRDVILRYVTAFLFITLVIFGLSRWII